MDTVKDRQRKELQIRSVPVGINSDDISLSRKSSAEGRSTFSNFSPRRPSCAKYSVLGFPVLNGRPTKEASWQSEGVNALLRRTTHKYGCNDTAETGLYSPELTDFYRVLMRENSEIPAPSQSSKRVEINDYDHTQITEKNYVLSEFNDEANITKFERDEMMFPSVYRDYFSCQNCKRAYVSDKFTRRYVKRNMRESSCAVILQNPIKRQQHFCDVLGKRYCSSCVEKENRMFSRSLEESLPIITDTFHVTHPQRKIKRKINVDMRFVSKFS